eukprot:5197195-Pyramimonas_sp.AAC.2
MYPRFLRMTGPSQRWCAGGDVIASVARGGGSGGRPAERAGCVPPAGGTAAQGPSPGTPGRGIRRRTLGYKQIETDIT